MGGRCARSAHPLGNYRAAKQTIRPARIVTRGHRLLKAAGHGVYPSADSQVLTCLLPVQHGPCRVGIHDAPARATRSHSGERAPKRSATRLFQAAVQLEKSTVV